MAGRLTVNLVIIFSIWIGVGHAQELTIVTEDYPPLNFVKDGKITGSSVEVVREMLRRLKQPDNIVMLPWARGYNLLTTRPNVALFSTSRTEERETLFHWVGPLCTSQNGFYAKKSSAIRIRTLEDAKNVRSIATYKEDSREQQLKSWGFTNLDSSKSPVSNLKKLLSGRVDLWVSDSLGMPKVAEKVGIDPAELKLVLPLDEVSLYIAFSRETPEKIVKSWQAVLDDMKRDATFDLISKKWLPASSIPKVPSKNHLTQLRIFTEDSPPGNYLHNGELTGLSVEVIREILGRLNLPDDIQVVPWARGYHLLLHQPNVALFSTTRLPLREKRFKWVGPLYTQTWGFYAAKSSNLQIGSLEDAKKVARIGTYHADAKEQFLKQQGFTNLVSSNKNINNIRRIMEGKLDLWLSSDFNMPYLARQAGVSPSQLKLVHAFREVDNYIAFSIQTPDEVITLWQRILDDLKSDGTYASLRKKYN